MSARLPLIRTWPPATASAHGSRPLATMIQVTGAISTTFAGVPLVCRGPAQHWTAPYGGMRTSTDRPGARPARSASNVRTASRSAAGSGVRPASSAASTTATAGDLLCGEDTSGRYDPPSRHFSLPLGRAHPVRQGIVADGVLVMG